MHEPIGYRTLELRSTHRSHLLEIATAIGHSDRCPVVAVFDIAYRKKASRSATRSGFPSVYARCTVAPGTRL